MSTTIKLSDQSNNNTLTFNPTTREMSLRDDTGYDIALFITRETCRAVAAMTLADGVSVLHHDGGLLNKRLRFSAKTVTPRVVITTYERGTDKSAAIALWKE